MKQSFITSVPGHFSVDSGQINRYFSYIVSSNCFRGITLIALDNMVSM